MRIFATALTALFLSCSVVSVTAYGADTDTALLQGKVLNSEGRPIGGARVLMHNDDSQAETVVRTDGAGEFEIDHPLCSTLSFSVLPPEKSGLASAHYANVSGEEPKHFIIQLRHGFHVTGRVMAEGQGVKGLEISVFAPDGEGKTATVHGGGFARTNSKGEYSLLLIPGKKNFQISNKIFSNLSPLYQQEFKITGDVRLPDMTLPLTDGK